MLNLMVIYMVRVLMIFLVITCREEIDGKQRRKACYLRPVKNYTAILTLSCEGRNYMTI